MVESIALQELTNLNLVLSAKTTDVKLYSNEKNTTYSFSSILYLLPKKQNNTQLMESLNTKIDNWYLAAFNADFNQYFDFIADNGIFIGTDITERWSRIEFSTSSQDLILIKVKPGLLNLKNETFDLINRKQLLGLMRSYILGWEIADLLEY